MPGSRRSSENGPPLKPQHGKLREDSVAAEIFKQGDTPAHLFSIRELDFSTDLFAKRLDGLWVRLEAWTFTNCRDERGVEDEVMRQSLLLAPEQFAAVFDKLDSVGNVFHNLGKPSGWVRQEGRGKVYSYAPVDRFQLPFTSVTGEPLVFVHSDTSRIRLFINPDLWLYLELEEKTAGSGIWWDPRRGVDSMVRHVIDEDNLEIVEIRVDYLLRYLQARQMSLVIGHYRHLHLFDPPPSVIEKFVTGDVILGSPEQGSKAILQNWGLRKDAGGRPFLQRRLHLWFEIKPPAMDTEHPWVGDPPFDSYSFTLPTGRGAVAPARWRHLRNSEKRSFEGEACDFMDRVYFRQEVLTKYEAASGFEVRDDGSVSCHHYWGLTRSTSRIGNELLATAIGDFAEGVPFEEWPHWKQYAVEPPSADTLRVLVQETPIPKAVNCLLTSLNRLTVGFAGMAASLGVTLPDALWRGSLDSIAGRQLNWVYPSTAADDEFLKRATLASTLFLDGLHSAPLRKLLKSIDVNLYRTFDSPPGPLGSRTLLQRVTLVALLIEEFDVDISRLPELVKRAEGKVKNAAEPDLQAELEDLYIRVRDEFAPLALLYDLRTYGGLAHPPNNEEAAGAASKLGLPNGNWHRTDYLHLLRLLAESFERITEHLEAAAQATI